jgi:hypothetical protein
MTRLGESRSDATGSATVTVGDSVGDSVDDPASRETDMSREPQRRDPTAQTGRVLDLRCATCGREIQGDPFYEAIGAVPRPDDVSRQVVAYHTLRRRFDEMGCGALGLEHRSADIMPAARPSTPQG